MKKSWHGVGCRVKEQQQFKMPLFGRSGAHDAELRRPGQFGPYFLQELINSGGMASIWLATDTQARAVAIRLLHHPLRFNFAARRRFLRGCEILSKIHSHEYVISYIAHGKIDGDLFLAMEYVEGENLKLLCARAGVNLRDVQRGYADLAKLRRAAEAWESVAQRLAVVEGSSQLTVAQVRAQARRAMRHHQTERCLVVVDYLQLWAKVAEDLRGNFSVRERVEMLGGLLRELALGLHSPVLALASQNRSAGNYGNGKGSAALDSLKESGDLEYAADVVLFLTEAQERFATPPARAVDLSVAKNRHGETGKVGLIFRPDLGTMREEAKS